MALKVSIPQVLAALVDAVTSLRSPEIGPLFGTVIARALDAWWRDMGRPHDFHIYDVGAGPGGLARAVMLRSQTVWLVMFRDTCV